jgi:hypothetical protein
MLIEDYRGAGVKKLTVAFWFILWFSVVCVLTIFILSFSMINKKVYFPKKKRKRKISAF